MEHIHPPPPFKIKMVEKIHLPSPDIREKNLIKAHFNVFQMPAQDVYIDLLTDSGTSAMSDQQWSALLLGDEAYAGGRSFYKFQKTVQNILGHRDVLPVHQGRGGEHIFFSTLLTKPNLVIPNNTHFDTTRANIECLGAKALDLPCKESRDLQTLYPFKGNMDLEGLENAINQIGKERIPFVMMTITNNACGGQPASLENIKAVRALCQKHGLPFFFDACRFAENCYFIQQKERQRPLKDIILEVFSQVDGSLISGKKDALSNIGGFITLQDKSLLHPLSHQLILKEGFCTYGGLAGRDLEGMAIGLTEVVEEDYLEFRTKQVEYLGHLLTKKGITIVQPTGGHAIYVDASAFLPHMAREYFPGQVLVVALYRHFGIRCCEIGSVMFPDPPPPRDLVRLAIPRRVYTNDHIRYVGVALDRLYQKRDSLKGLKIIKEPPYLRHFTAQFAEIDSPTF